MSDRPPDIRLDDPRVADVAALVRAELEAEVAAGLAALTRIPSTGIIKFLDYFATLGAADRQALLDMLARTAALRFFPAPLIAAAHEELRTTDPAALRLHAALGGSPFGMGLRYAGLRMARMLLNDPESVRQMALTRATLDFAPRDDPPEALVGTTAMRDVQTAKAPLLRKLLNQTLPRLLSVKPVKRPGGEIIYDGMIGAVPLRVSIMFSGLYAQMYYAVTWSMRERMLLAQRLNYDSLWAGDTDWDYLTEENAAGSIELLGCLLVRLARLFARVAALPRG